MAINKYLVKDVSLLQKFYIIIWSVTAWLVAITVRELQGALSWAMAVDAMCQSLARGGSPCDWVCL